MEKQRQPYKLVKRDISNNWHLVKREAETGWPCNKPGATIPSYQTAQLFHHDCYITAQLEELPEGGYFIVGDNKTYGGYYNAPLEPGGQYVVWIGQQVTVDGVSTCL